MKMERKRYIFTSDLHLGAEKYAASQQDFISFLTNLPKDTAALYLLGDVFDFWFERKRRPVGYEAVIQALSETVSRGVEVYFLKGNHDWWTFGRLERETGIKVLGPQPVTLNLNGKHLVIAHGDDLGPMDFKARLTRRVLKGRLSIFLARYLVPERLLYHLAEVWTRSSRRSNDLKPYTFTTESPLYRFACSYERCNPVDYFVFGHIHRPVDMSTPGGAGLHILNDWSQGPNWLGFDGETISRYFCTFEN